MWAARRIGGPDPLIRLTQPLAFVRRREDAEISTGEMEDHVFVQIIEGRAADADGMRRQMERWMEELRPGAEGFLGTTAGVTPEGRAIAIVRFDSRAAATANSERAEQGAWWSEMEKCYDGEVSFTESEDVETFLDGGSDSAGFVQVMKGRDLDREAVARLDALFEEHAPTVRPDVIGGLRAWTGPDSAYDVLYFTSEEDARAGESKPMPPEFDDAGADFEQMMANTEFLDLPDPWIH